MNTTKKGTFFNSEQGKQKLLQLKEIVYVNFIINGGCIHGGGLKYHTFFNFQFFL